MPSKQHHPPASQSFPNPRSSANGASGGTASPPHFSSTTPSIGSSWTFGSSNPSIRPVLPGLSPPLHAQAWAPGSSSFVSVQTSDNPYSTNVTHASMPPNTAQHSSPASGADQESSEKEEGELSETPTSRVSSLAGRSSPVKPPAGPRISTLHADRRLPVERQPSALSLASKENRNERNPAKSEDAGKWDHAKTFIESWNRSGHTFQQLVDEGFDSQILTTIYDELGILTDNSPLTVPTNAPSSSFKLHSTEPSPKSTQADPASRQVDGPPDRQSYIARLMAAKSKKPISDGTTSSSKPAPSNAEPTQNNTNLPKPPVASAALQSLQQLCHKHSLKPPEIYVNQIREQTFSAELRIHSIPTHLRPHIKPSSSTIVDKSTSKAPEAEIILESEATLLVQQKGFSSKKLARQAIAQTAFVVFTAAIDASHHAPSKSVIAHTKNIDKVEKGTTDASSTSESSKSQNKPQKVPSSAAQTELVHQKLQALKSARVKASQPPLLPSSTVPTAPTGPVLSTAIDHPNTSIAPSQDQDAGAALPSTTGQIPGIFMTTTQSKFGPEQTPLIRSNEPSDVENSHSIPQSLGFAPTTSNKHRKRPVAADFNDDIEPPLMKRPFGQIRGENSEQEMIIEASDEDDALGDEMIMQNFHVDSDAAAKRSGEAGTNRKLAESGPLRFSGKEHHYHSAERTQTPVSINHGVGLYEKNILAMKKRLSELESKQKSKLPPSRSNTPATTPNAGAQVEASESSAHLDDKLEEFSPHTPLPLESLPQLSVVAFPSPTTKSQDTTSRNLTPAILAESSSVPQTEWKRRRRSEIKTDLPALEASYEDDSREFERLKAQMERLQDEMTKKQQNKQRLVEELENLGVDTEGMPDAELQATKDFLDAQHEEQAATDKDTALHMAATNQSMDNSSASSMSISSPEETTFEVIQGSSRRTDGTGGFPSLGQNPAGHENSATLADAVNNIESHQHEPAQDIETNLHNNSLTDSSAGGRHALEDQSDARTPASGSSAHFADNEEMDSSENSEDAANVRDSTFDDAEHSHLEPDSADQDVDHQHERDMADQDMNDQHERDMADQEANHPHEHDIADQDVNQHKASSAVEDSDEYDPSNALEQNPALQTDRTQGSNNVEGQKTESEEINESSGEYEPEEPHMPSDGSKSMDEGILTVTQENSMIDTLENQQSDAAERVADDLASEIQGQPPQEQDYSDVESAQDLPQRERFTPYRSTLKLFKSFKTQAQSSNTNTEQLRSPGLPHKIDHDRELCPFELAGGVCNDEKCDHQHFRAIIPDGDD